MLTVAKILCKILFYLFLLWCGFAVAVYLHEWTHGTLAWIFGYKSSPFAIDYGGWSLSNVLYFSNIDQAVNNYAIALIGHPLQSAIILVVPPIIINGGLTLISFRLLRKSLQRHTAPRAWLWFLYGSIIWNMGEFFSYTCLRAFSTHADIGLFLEYTGFSPWVIFVPGFYLSAYGYHRFFGYYKTAVMQRLGFNAFTRQIVGAVSVLLLTLFLLMRTVGSHFGPIPNVISGMTLLIMPYLWWRYCLKNKSA